MTSLIKDHQRRLTDAGVSRQTLANTQQGQAYFGGTGPDGKTCRECFHWLGAESHRKVDGWLRKAACGKGTGKVIGHDALACKYFEEVENPPRAFFKESV